MDVLQRFALGEIDAFETLARQFQGDIYAWIVRMVRDPGIAEDLTVEDSLADLPGTSTVSSERKFRCLDAADRHEPGPRPSPAQTPGTEFARRTRRGAST